MVSEVEASDARGVVCLFCGSRTALPAAAAGRAAHAQLEPCVTLVRCNICGKEAPYSPHHIVSLRDAA